MWLMLQIICAIYLEHEIIIIFNWMIFNKEK